MAKSRSHYEQLFSKFPDVVTIPEFCRMLGGIADSTARKLVRKNIVRHYYVRDTYLIPKSWIIDYVLSNHYDKYKKELKVQI
jgi:hypothetical protein